jgi:hypothetical protein
LEGEAILIGDILKMDISTKYFSHGNLAQSLVETSKKRCFLDTSFLVWGGFFPPPSGTRRS